MSDSSTTVTGGKTLKEQVDLFTGSRRLSIAHPLIHYARTQSFTELPRHSDFHWRGLWQPDPGYVHGMFSESDDLLPAVAGKSRRKEFVPYCEAVLCHNKPIDSRYPRRGCESKYPDIPDRLDIYFLLRHQYSAIAFAGRTIAAIIRRTEDSYPAILRLRDWEADRASGRYRRSRGRSQLRRAMGREPDQMTVDRQHANSALRALGLVWPGKPSDRHKQWADCLRGIGLAVETSADLGPIRSRVTSREDQEEMREYYKMMNEP
jgi:hypothetical protein